MDLLPLSLQQGYSYLKKEFQTSSNLYEGFGIKDEQDAAVLLQQQIGAETTALQSDTDILVNREIANANTIDPKKNPYIGKNWFLADGKTMVYVTNMSYVKMYPSDITGILQKAYADPSKIFPSMTPFMKKFPKLPLPTDTSKYLPSSITIDVIKNAKVGDKIYKNKSPAYNLYAGSSVSNLSIGYEGSNVQVTTNWFIPTGKGIGCYNATDKSLTILKKDKSNISSNDCSILAANAGDKFYGISYYDNILGKTGSQNICYGTNSNTSTYNTNVSNTSTLTLLKSYPPSASTIKIESTTKAVKYHDKWGRTKYKNVTTNKTVKVPQVLTGVYSCMITPTGGIAVYNTTATCNSTYILGKNEGIGMAGPTGMGCCVTYLQPSIGFKNSLQNNSATDPTSLKYLSLYDDGTVALGHTIANMISKNGTTNTNYIKINDVGSSSTMKVTPNFFQSNNSNANVATYLNYSKNISSTPDQTQITSKNYMTSADILVVGQSISSPKASVIIKLESSGLLNIYATNISSNCANGIGNKNTTGIGLNMMDLPMHPEVMGFIGYVDFDAVLHPYTNNNLKDSNNPNWLKIPIMPVDSVIWSDFKQGGLMSNSIPTTITEDNSALNAAMQLVRNDLVTNTSNLASINGDIANGTENTKELVNNINAKSGQYAQNQQNIDNYNKLINEGFQNLNILPNNSIGMNFQEGYRVSELDNVVKDSSIVTNQGIISYTLWTIIATLILIFTIELLSGKKNPVGWFYISIALFIIISNFLFKEYTIYINTLIILFIIIRNKLLYANI